MSENKNIDPKLQEALKGIWNSLTDEQREKAKACKTMDELTALAAKEGVELSDELLDAVAGGYIFDTGRGWEVISDSDGEVIDGYYPWSREQVESKAKCCNQSTQQIYWCQLERLRNTGSIDLPQPPQPPQPPQRKSGC